MDWMGVAEKLPAIIGGAKDFVVAGAAVCTTFFAWKALSKWRDEAIGKRRLDLAEEVLSAAYQIRETIQDARAPLIWASEMVVEEGIAERVSRSPYYAPVRRLHRAFDKILDFRIKRHRFAAVFGIESAAPWDEIETVLREIDAASQSLIEMGDQDVPRSDPLSDFYIKQRRLLARGGDDDPIAVRLDAAVKKIEAVCTPIIRASVR